MLAGEGTCEFEPIAWRGRAWSRRTSNRLLVFRGSSNHQSLAGDRGPDVVKIAFRSQPSTGRFSRPAGLFNQSVFLKDVSTMGRDWSRRCQHPRIKILFTTFRAWSDPLMHLKE